MAHGRGGPDLVMTTRYVGASEIGQMTNHERNRTPDGFSAIDERRTHLNKILHGPATQHLALKKLWDSGVRRPTAQAERPYVQTVISASPNFFRDGSQGVGEWNEARLKKWIEVTMAWLRKEYGPDLAHVALHLDEDTPHLHVLIVPTYERRPRRPGKPAKNETLAEFDARIFAAQTGKTTRTVSRSSNKYWSKISVRRDARKSYHAAVEHLGIGYGRDFVAAGQPSPQNKTTAKWVREEAARVAEDRAHFSSDRAALDAEIVEADEYRLKYRGEAEKIKAHQQRKSSMLAREKLALEQMRTKIERDRDTIQSAMRALQGVIDAVGTTLDVRWPDGMTAMVDKIELLIKSLPDQTRSVSEPQGDGDSVPRV